MLWIVLAIVAVLVVIAIVTYNSLIRSRNQVENAWSQIDVQLKRRIDLIPNLVETVKAYAAHEKETLDAVIRARNAAMAAPSDPHAQAAADTMMTGAGPLRDAKCLAKRSASMVAEVTTILRSGLRGKICRR